MNGEPLTKLLDADESKEVAVFGAIWIAAPAKRYVEAVHDIENLEKGGKVKITRRISSPPTLDDFSDLRLPEDDVDDLRSCRIGQCEVKLGADSIQTIRSELNWSKPDVHNTAQGLMRRLAFEYVSGYLAGGNERLAVYRDSSRPISVAAELRPMVDDLPLLTTSMPSVRRYLLDYPRAELDGATSFVYWQSMDFGLKQTVRINHLTIHEAADGNVVASKMLYASHYFWAALELRVMLPDPARGSGFWFVMINQSRSDGLSGFKGLFVGRRVRSGAVNAVHGALTATKRKLEQRP